MPIWEGQLEKHVGWPIPPLWDLQGAMRSVIRVKLSIRMNIVEVIVNLPAEGSAHTPRSSHSRRCWGETPAPCYSDVMLRWYYSGVTDTLRWCCIGATLVLEVSHSRRWCGEIPATCCGDVAVVLQQWSNGVTLVLEWCYIGVRVVLRWC